jgi:hypothetical protein
MFYRPTTGLKSFMHHGFRKFDLSNIFFKKHASHVIDFKYFKTILSKFSPKKKKLPFGGALAIRFGISSYFIMTLKFLFVHTLKNRKKP